MAQIADAGIDEERHRGDENRGQGRRDVPLAHRDEDERHGDFTRRIRSNRAAAPPQAAERATVQRPGQEERGTELAANSHHARGVTRSQP